MIPCSASLNFSLEILVGVNLPFPIAGDQGLFDPEKFFSLHVKEILGPLEDAVDELGPLLLPLHLRVNQGPEFAVLVVQPERQGKNPLPQLEVPVRDLDQAEAVLLDGIVEAFVPAVARTWAGLLDLEGRLAFPARAPFFPGLLELAHRRKEQIIGVFHLSPALELAVFLLESPVLSDGLPDRRVIDAFRLVHHFLDGAEFSVIVAGQEIARALRGHFVADLLGQRKGRPGPRADDRFGGSIRVGDLGELLLQAVKEVLVDFLVGGNDQLPVFNPG